MEFKHLNIIGLMTGTSMDGIDISLVKTNGIDLQNLNENYFYEYDSKTKDVFLNLLKNNLSDNLNIKRDLDKLITEEHFKALKDLKILEQCDLVGFHGQTIYHNAQDGLSLQVGDPTLLSELIKKNVIYDFRSRDMQLGGQGAPLAPIYHKLLIQNNKLELPSCFLNIGGVANLTYWDGQILHGFDTGPGNGLMDTFIRSISQNFYDKNGEIASKGIPNKVLIQSFLNDIFFKKSPPKSLDRNSFKIYYDKLLKKKLSTPDTLATLLAFTVESIVAAIDILPKKIKSIVVTGGGYKNIYLMKCLKNKLKIKFYRENELNANFDFVESELIAYLSARSIYKLPFTFPSTTGVSISSSGGKAIFYKNPN